MTHSMHRTTVALTRFPMSSMVTTVISLPTTTSPARSTRLEGQTTSTPMSVGHSRPEVHLMIALRRPIQRAFISIRPRNGSTIYWRRNETSVTLRQPLAHAATATSPTHPVCYLTGQYFLVARYVSFVFVDTGECV